jgi:Coenzyme PQQ synthesis protein D (PqqD)
MREATRPRAKDELVVERLDGEVLIYDVQRNRAHHLNETAALVFEHCDGQRTVEELAAVLSERSGQPLDAEVVRRALVRLSDAHLLDGPTAEWSRRQALRRIGVAGAAAGLGLPVVKSIVAPTPAAAQATCANDGAFCGTQSGPTCVPELPCCSQNFGCMPNSGNSCICIQIN